MSVATRGPRGSGKPARGESIWWALFGQGGLVAAVLIPVTILVSGILGPLGLVPYVDGSYQTFAPALANPIVKLYLFVLISLPMFHAAHRFHFWLHHLGVHAGRRAMPALSYGAAIVITIVTAYILVTTP